jgi:hypothetical protein
VTLSDQFADRYQTTVFQAEALANCSQTPALQIIDFFDRLQNRIRAVDLRNAPQAQEYVYRTGMCVFSSDMYVLMKRAFDPCDEPSNTYKTVASGETLKVYMLVYEEIQMNQELIQVSEWNTEYSLMTNDVANELIRDQMEHTCIRSLQT